MNIDIWGFKQEDGTWGDTGPKGWGPLFNSWQKLDTSFNIRYVESDQKYLKHLQGLTNIEHNYIRLWRTILKINGKHIYFDCTERPSLSAESWKLPFDLIIKCQYDNSPEFYDASISPVSPFIYPLRYYDIPLLYHYRQLQEETMRTQNFDSSIFWSGAIYTRPAQRSVVRNKIEQTKRGKTGRLVFDEYLQSMATTQICAGVAGVGEFAHRDSELAGIGTPYFRKEFKNITYIPRIPNVHYYSIGGDEIGMAATMDYFINYFEPNGEYRKFSGEEWDKYCSISSASKKWFDDTATPEASFKIFCEILEKYKII